jgi:tRNA(Ile2) C34 agmatinyltransferase TiaS
LRQASGIELRNAKAVEMHITRTAGVCQRCQGQLESSGQTECPKCGSLNLDW